MALSLLLLVSAGLFLRSLRSATEIDTGFRSEGLLLASVDPGLQGYGREETEAFYLRLLERVRTLPGVAAAGLGENVPLGFGSQQNGVQVPGYEFAPDERRSIDYNLVGAGYFEAMGIRMVEGRSFTPEDDGVAEPVLVVNRRFAERFWPGESALGRIVHTSGADRRVVGVTEDGRYNTLGEEPLAFMYLPHAQAFNYAMTLHVRTADPTAAGRIATALRQEIRTLDPDLPVYDVRTMENHLGIALLPARLGGFGLGLFGGLGLLLAAVGIYGVMAYSVARRRREMGIRMALGAAPAGVVALVLREGLGLALIGAALGLLAALAAARLLEGLLYGVSALDPVAFTVVPALLVGVAALAVWLPARRAAGVDPARSLRAE
jgi:predicted permease